MIAGLVVLFLLASAAVAVLMLGLMTLRDSGGDGPTATEITAPAEVVLDLASGRLQEIPTQLESAGLADIDGDRLVWWEGTYSTTVEEWAEQGIFAYRLPSGPRVELVGKELGPGFLATLGGRRARRLLGRRRPVSAQPRDRRGAPPRCRGRLARTGRVVRDLPAALDAHGHFRLGHRVTLGLADGSEQVVGQQTTPPWFGSVISVAQRHVAYVDDEGRPHIYERRSR